MITIWSLKIARMSFVFSHSPHLCSVQEIRFGTDISFWVLQEYFCVWNEHTERSLM